MEANVLIFINMITIPSIKLNISKENSSVKRKMVLQCLLFLHYLNVIHICTELCKNIFDSFRANIIAILKITTGHNFIENVDGTMLYYCLIVI